MIIRDKTRYDRLVPDQLLLCIETDTDVYLTGLIYRVSDCGYYIFDSYGTNPTFKGNSADHSCCSSFRNTSFMLAPNLALLLHGELDEN